MTDTIVWEYEVARSANARQLAHNLNKKAGGGWEPLGAPVPDDEGFLTVILRRPKGDG